MAVAVGVAVVALWARRGRCLLQTHQHVHLSAQLSVSSTELYARSSFFHTQVIVDTVHLV